MRVRNIGLVADEVLLLNLSANFKNLEVKFSRFGRKFKNVKDAMLKIQIEAVNLNYWISIFLCSLWQLVVKSKNIKNLGLNLVFWV